MGGAPCGFCDSRVEGYFETVRFINGRCQPSFTQILRRSSRESRISRLITDVGAKAALCEVVCDDTQNDNDRLRASTQVERGDRERPGRTRNAVATGKSETPATQF